VGHLGGFRHVPALEPLDSRGPGLRSPQGSDVNVRSKIVRAREPRELRWLDEWTVPGMFSSERRFKIEALPEGGVRFHHGEQSQGLMASLLTQRNQMRTKSALDGMNTALKHRAERAFARTAPATAS
jgi:hypothetical protein